VRSSEAATMEVEASLMASRHDIAVQLYRTDFRAFVDFAFAQLHLGQTPIPHWYIDLIADRIEGDRCSKNGLVMDRKCLEGA
jgi:hypothetical protein